MRIRTYGLFQHEPLVAQLKELPGTQVTTSLDYADEANLNSCDVVVARTDVDPSELRPLCGKLYASLQENTQQLVLLIDESTEAPLPLRQFAKAYRGVHVLTNDHLQANPQFALHLLHQHGQRAA